VYYFIRTIILVLAMIFAQHAKAEAWDYLVLEENNVIGVRGVSKLGEGGLARHMSFNLLEGFMPKGKDLGYGKAVGTRIRHVLFGCDSDNVLITGMWVRDVEQNIIEKTEAKSLDSAISVSRNSDPALTRATQYVCGDKSAKLAAPRQSVTKEPKDLMHLVCRPVDSDKEFVFGVSYAERTVDGIPAMIDKALIRVSMQVPNDVMIVSINRVTGRFDVESSKDGFLFTGNCDVQTKAKF
jgi:hypothetical protein